MRFRHLLVSVFVVAHLFLVARSALAEDVFRYPEAKHAGGELKYVRGIPVATLAGSPEEIGEQWGALVLKPATKLTKSADEIVEQYGWKHAYDLVLHTGSLMRVQFPPDYVKEMDVAARESGWKRELLSFGNTVIDLRHIVQCSAVIFEGERSATGAPVFGRNMDWPSVAKLHEYTLLVVYRPTGKRAFASVTFPGILGCVSAMNDAGLAVAMVEAESNKDGSPGLNLAGLPTFFLLRRVLEECGSVDEAVALVRSAERASPLNIAICDRQRGAVLEVTTKTVVERKPEKGVVMCTNHFRSDDLATEKKCWRYEELEKSTRGDKYSVAEVAERLHAVNQDDMTIQTMIFEPAALKLHLAFGKGPATGKPMSELDLGELFKGESPRKDK